jgi:hypothetical protein
VREFTTRGGDAMVLRAWSHLDWHGSDPKNCEQARTAEVDASVGPWGKTT